MLDKLKIRAAQLFTRPASLPLAAETPSRAGAVSETNTEDMIFQTVSTIRACKNAFARGVTINTIIDIGASNGSWSEALMPLLPPSVSYLLVEANSCHEPALINFCQKFSNAAYVLAAAGNNDGSCFFDNSDPYGGLASTIEGYCECNHEVPMRQVDTLISDNGLQGPFLLKLDTHGFEVPILQGAKQCLQHAELVVIETYIFRLREQALLFHELCAYMYEQGFQCVDLSEPLWRKADMALWQLDLFFQRRDAPMFQNNSYA